MKPTVTDQNIKDNIDENVGVGKGRRKKLTDLFFYAHENLFCSQGRKIKHEEFFFFLKTTIKFTVQLQFYVSGLLEII